MPKTTKVNVKGQSGCISFVKVEKNKHGVLCYWYCCENNCDGWTLETPHPIPTTRFGPGKESQYTAMVKAHARSGYHKWNRNKMQCKPASENNSDSKKQKIDNHNTPSQYVELQMAIKVNVAVDAKVNMGSCMGI